MSCSHIFIIIEMNFLFISYIIIFFHYLYFYYYH